MSEWCEHCIHSPMPNDRKEFHLKGMMIYCDKFNFCPICGTPRPREKSLAEKFEDANNLFLEVPETDTRIYKLKRESAEKLADIATTHFNPQSKGESK